MAQPHANNTPPQNAQHDPVTAASGQRDASSHDTLGYDSAEVEGKRTATYADEAAKTANQLDNAHDQKQDEVQQRVAAAEK